MAELEAVDRTVTRIGANTVFAFGPDRTMHLDRGSILFHTPHGKGGGKIQTGGASASVLGTTLIVTATDDGGFKTIVLEGKAEVRLSNGDFRILKAGQLAFVLAGSQKFGPVLTIHLSKLVAGSGLVQDFERALSSLPRIQTAILTQNKLIEAGRATDTGLLVGRRATEDRVEILDASILERVIAQQASEKPFRKDAVVSGGVLPGSDNSSTAKRTSMEARNLRIQSSTIDLTPYMQGPANDFTFHASEELEVAGSVDFIGNGRPGFELSLEGDKRVKIKSNKRVTATGVGDVLLQSGTELRLRKVQVENRSGSLELSANDEIRVDASEVRSSGRTLVTGAKDVKVEDDSILGGDLVEVDAGRKLQIEDSVLNGADVVMRAAETLTWQNVSLAGVNTISLAARTLVLEDVAFPSGSTVELRSELGVLAPQPNTGRSPVAGHVNFIENVTYGGAPAQNAVGGSIKIRPR